MKEQKLVQVPKGGSEWVGYVTGGYLANQIHGKSGLQEDLERGWRIKFIAEDSYVVAIILER